MDMTGIIVFGLFIGFFILIAIYTYYQARVRREAWQKVAGELGFKFMETGNVHDRFPQFKIFTLGHSHYSLNQLSGDNGTDEVLTVDYQYSTGGGKHKHTHLQTLCIIRSKTLSLPHFFLRRESRIWDYFGKLFGGQDINFDEDPAFSKAFVLQGENEASVRNFFQAPVRKFFLGYEGTDFQIEGRDDVLLLNPGTRIEPTDAKPFIARTLSLKSSLARSQES